MNKFSPNKSEAASDFLNEQRVAPEDQKDKPYTGLDLARDVYGKNKSGVDEDEKRRAGLKKNLSSSKLAADKAFVNAQQEARKKVQDFLKNLGNKKPEPEIISEPEIKPETVAAVEGAGESVAAPGMIPETVAEKPKFPHDFLQALFEWKASAESCVIQVYKNEDGDVILKLTNSSLAGDNFEEISIEKLSELSRKFITIPSLTNSDKRGRFLKDLSMAIFSTFALNIPKVEFVREIKQDSSAEEKEHSETGAPVVQPGSDMPAWLSSGADDKIVVSDKPIRKPSRVAISSVPANSVIFQDPVPTQVRMAESGMNVPVLKHQQREGLPSHSSFQILSSLNGRSKYYQILVKADGPNTVITIVDR